jgi:hypothetical protein
MNSKPKTRNLKNAYTNAPDLHPNLILGSLQLLFWLFFHPSAWRNHVARIDPILHPDFALAELSLAQWRNPALRRLLMMAYIVWPLLVGSLVGLVLWVVGKSGQEIAYGAAYGVTFSVVFSVTVGVTVGLAVGLAGGVVGGAASGLAGGVAFGVLGGVAFGVAGGVAFGLVVGWRRGMAVRVAFGVAVGVAVSVAFGIAFNLAVSLVYGAAIDVTGGLTYGLAYAVVFGVAVGMAVGWRTHRWRRGVAVGLALGAAVGVIVGMVGSATGGVAGSAAVGVAQSAFFSVFFALHYVLAERIAGPWAGAVTGALAGVAYFALADPLSPLPIGILLGLTLAWWRPVLLYPFLAAWNILLYHADEQYSSGRSSLLRWHSAFWDEFQRLPLLGLDQHLILVAERNPVEGQAAIECLATSRQRWAAQKAQNELKENP